MSLSPCEDSCRPPPSQPPCSLSPPCKALSPFSPLPPLVGVCHVDRALTDKWYGNPVENWVNGVLTRRLSPYVEAVDLQSAMAMVHRFSARPQFAFYN